MRITVPYTVRDENILASNLLEELPAATSAVNYSAWSSGTTYASGATVCLVYTTTGGQYAVPPNPGTGGAPTESTQTYGDVLFSVFTSNYASNLNNEPARLFDGGTGTLPGYYQWTYGRTASAWDSTISYPMGAIVGRISGSNGAFYQSLIASNLNNDPASSPTAWRQTTLDSYNTWSSGTTYASGDVVVTFYGTFGSVFTSLQNSNTNHNPASSPTWWSYTGAVNKRWVSTTTYATGDYVSDARTHHLYESLQGSNTNKDPTDSSNDAWWLDHGATNRWAMFDLSVDSVSSNATTIDVTLQFSEACDTIALLGMQANQVQIICYNGATETYNQTFNLTDNGSITDWRHYFFDPLTYDAGFIANDLPPYTDGKVRFILTYTGGIAKLGAALIGLADEIGTTVYGANVGMLSFSERTRNDFGVATLVPRPAAARDTYKVVIDKARVDGLKVKMRNLDAVPALYQGSDLYAATWTFGFFRDQSISIEHMEKSYLSVEVEGLV